MAVIALEGMKFYAYHGFYQEERLIGGYFLVDVYIETNIQAAALENDDLLGTINYETVFAICKRLMAVPVKLLEKVAYSILQEITDLANSSNHIRQVKVRVSKLNPPLAGQVARTFIEVDKNLDIR